MEKPVQNEYQINLRSLLIAVFQEKWLILLVSAVVAISAFIYCKVTKATVYTTSTSIYILNNNDSNAPANSDFQTASLLTDDYKELIKSIAVTEGVVDKLELEMTPQQLSSRIAVSSKEDTRIINIAISDSDPYEAARIANAVREIASVKIVDIMKIDAVQLVNEADIPTAKSGSGAAKTAVLAFLVTIVLGVVLICVIDVLNDTIKSPEEVITRLGINSLGAIPYNRDGKKGHADAEGEDY